MKALFEFKLSNLVKLSAFVIPIVPAASMADAVFKEVTVGTSFQDFAFITIMLALVGGLGFEMVGIGAGHLSVQFFVDSKWGFFSLSLVALLVYVSIGFYEFGASTSGLFLIIAPFVYLLSGMIETSEKEQLAAQKERARLDAIEDEARARQAQTDRLNHELELEQARFNAQAAREEKARRAEFGRQQKAVNQVSGKVSAGVASSLQQLAQMVANEALVNRVLPEVKGTKKVIIETLVATPNATRAQLATKAGVSPQAISNNANSLAKMFFKMAENFKPLNGAG